MHQALCAFSRALRFDKCQVFTDFKMSLCPIFDEYALKQILK